MATKMTEDLWGEIPGPENIKTPVVILSEQAAMLAEKTKNVLIGRVRTYTVERSFPSGLQKALETTQLGTEMKFAATLEIVAPVLDSYSIVVLELRYGLRPYPVILQRKLEDSESICYKEYEFTDALTSTLRSRELMDVFSLLITQSRAAAKVTRSPKVSR